MLDDPVTVIYWFQFPPFIVWAMMFIMDNGTIPLSLYGDLLFDRQFSLFANGMIELPKTNQDECQFDIFIRRETVDQNSMSTHGDTFLIGSRILFDQYIRIKTCQISYMSDRRAEL